MVSLSSSTAPEILRLSYVFPSAFEYFTDSSKTPKPDVILIVGTDKFYCHRLLLSLISPVFNRMFDGEFKEHNGQEVILEGKTSESILELLKYIYPQFHGQITNNNVEDFLLLADEYMIDYLKPPCKDFLIKQLQSFKYVSIPTQLKLEQSSMKSKSFHTSESTLDSSQNQDVESFIRNNTNRIASTRQTISNTRNSTNKSASSYSKFHEKNGSSNNHSRYVLFLDKTQLPNFYDDNNTSIQFTTADVELWVRRLRIIYQIDKGQYYDEVIDYILSILQFIPAIKLFSLMHTAIDTYSIDNMILNDIARARMYMLEEWATDGDSYRLVSLSDSYRTMSLNVLTTTIQQTINGSADSIHDEANNSSNESLFIAADVEATDFES